MKIKKKMMNTTKLWTLLLFSAVLVAGVSCDKESFIDDKTQGLNLNINADLLRVPVSLQIVDANTLTAPENATVEVSGPDAEKVYSTVGKRDLVVNAGIIDFAMDKNEAPTPENPLEFSVRITAPGYVPTVQTYFIEDIEEQQQLRAMIIDRAAPPSGIVTGSAGFAGNLEGTANPVTLTVESSSEVPGSAELLFPSGTQFFNVNGAQLTGSVTAQAAYFDSESQEALDAFPGGLVAQNVKDEEGNVMEPVQFETAGFAAINLTVGGEEIRSFSQAVPVVMGLNPATINPETDAPIAMGDEIPFWSLDEVSGEWAREGVATVSEENGALVAKFDITHLSYYNLAWGKRACRRATMNIQSNIPKIHQGNGLNSHLGSDYEYFKVTVYRASNDSRLFSRGNIGPFYNGQRMVFRNAPDFDVYAEISRGSYWCNEVIVTTEIFNFCDEGTLSIDIPAPNDRLKVDAKISGVCSGADRSVEIRPSGYLLYKKSNCESYDFLGYFVNGRFVNRKLEIGETYDFGVVYGNDEYFFEGVTIESRTFEYDGQIFSVEIDSNNEINIDMTEIPIPDDICSSFGL